MRLAGVVVAPFKRCRGSKKTWWLTGMRCGGSLAVDVVARMRCGGSLTVDAVAHF